MSSTAVYADTLDRSRWPLTEAAALGPTGPGPAVAYGWSKVAAERLLQRRAAEGGFEWLVLRPATCYGSGSNSAEKLIKAAQIGAVLDRSSRVLQYLHVDDLASMAATLIWSAADRDTVHLAGPDALSWAAVQTLVRRVMKRHGMGRSATGEDPVDRPPMPLARFEFPYDLTHAFELGAMPRIGLREGLTEAAVELRGAKAGPRSSAAIPRRGRRTGVGDATTRREVERPWMSR
jgi:nucleoside-diphosphate-sugar epimerase